VVGGRDGLSRRDTLDALAALGAEPSCRPLLHDAPVLATLDIGHLREARGGVHDEPAIACFALELLGETCGGGPLAGGELGSSTRARSVLILR
jgi:hypothetical protein